MALHLEGQLPYHTPKRRVEGQRRKVHDWHFWFALIYRVRRLSTRSPGPASPVETIHPRVVYVIIHDFSVLYSVAAR